MAKKRNRQSKRKTDNSVTKASGMAAAEKVRANKELPEGARQAIPTKDEAAKLPEVVLKEYEPRLKALDKLLTDLKDRQDRLKRETEVLNTDKNTIADEKAASKDRINDLDGREKALIGRETEIELREANARNGFVRQQRESLAELRQEIAWLETERKNLSRQLDQDRRDARAKIRAERDAWGIQRAESEQELETVRQQLEAEHDRLEQQSRSQDSLERSIRAQINAEFESKIEAQNKRIKQLEESRTRDADVLEHQRDQLSGFAEMQRTLDRHDFDTPQALLDHYDELATENRRLRSERLSSDGAELEAEIEELRERCDEYETTLEDRRTEIGMLRNENSANRVSVLEKQTLAQEKRVLEAHKNALNSAVTDLERRLDDLTERQLGDETFPALAGMDSEYADTRSVEPLPSSLAEFADELRHRIVNATDEKLYYPKQVVRLFIGGLAMSQLHILTGISGTGKTSLAIAFAEAVGGEIKVVPVQAGWRDHNDLLGHYNAFERKYYESECLQAIYRAATPACANRINVVLLDEMNLSHPEQYFSKFLSALEVTQSKRGIELTETAASRPPKQLRDGRILTIPENLWFIGTANNDETTKGFADKTIDRAHSMELPRNECHFTPQKDLNRLPFDVNSLRKHFDDAQKKHRESVGSMIETIQGSGFATLLERDFNRGWGHRLERHAYKFAPVIAEIHDDFKAGLSEAFDHLLATRLFRPGQVTERYDVRPESLSSLSEELVSLWTKLAPDSEPTECMQRLEAEIKHKKDQG